MERFSRDCYAADAAASSMPEKPSSSASPLCCYWLHSDRNTHRAGFTVIEEDSFATLNADEFVLFTDADFTPPEALSREVDRCSDQRPELNFFLLMRASQCVASGLQSSKRVLQQLHVWPQWQQHYAVIIRAALAKKLLPVQDIHDVMLAGMINTESVWIVDIPHHVEGPVMNVPFTYQQFMREYEKLTRLTHYLPERHDYRRSFLRSGLMMLVQQDLMQKEQLSANIRHALRYYSGQYATQGVMEKIMLKQPDIYFSLMKMFK